MHSIRMLGVCLGLGLCTAGAADELTPLRFNHPGLEVDLGVGLWAWPLPMDYDGDGDWDLVVSCPDKPYRGTYFFENPGGSATMPIFKPPVRIADGPSNVQVSFVDGEPVVMTPAATYPQFRETGFAKPSKLPLPTNLLGAGHRIRANQWKQVDYDGDGRQDVIVGVGDWADYGWDDAFDERGRWTRGPLHGYVFLVRNTGTGYEAPVKIQAGGKPVDVFGMPSPNLADFDADGDLDLLCGEFLDGFTYFENVGSRRKPRYADGRRLTADGQPLHMDLQMITPVALDWDADGDMDLVCGDEDGRVAFIEHTGKSPDGLPAFRPPRYFRQQADLLKFGALVTPVSVDWDGDGDEDLICGNTAGYLGFIENLGNDSLREPTSDATPRWAEPRYLEADGEVIRYLAGPNGSIQGPCEAKWGYTAPSVADWDGDGLLDILVNGIWGRIEWHRNIGTKTAPKLAAAKPVEVAWNGPPPKPEWNWWSPRPGELATQWRTTPVAVDWTGDGLTDLVMLDHEGYLALFEREQTDKGLQLQSGKRVFRADGPSSFDGRQTPDKQRDGLLRLNHRTAGASGRRKLCVVDWDGDGRLDLLVNSVNVNFLRNIGQRDGQTVFRDEGPLSKTALAGHTTSPTVVDWNRDGVPDLLIGAEDGHFYYLKNPQEQVQAEPEP